MKTNQMIKGTLTAVCAIAVISFSACSSTTNKESANEHTPHNESAHAVPATTAISPEFQDQKVAAVYGHYVHLKNALVDGKSGEAQSGAAALQTALTDAGNAKGADLAGKIASVSDISPQRAELEALTAEVELVIKSSKLTRGIVYKQYCPMANDDKGGYWLSSNSEIRNPYFGEGMMDCGETKEEIK